MNRITLLLADDHEIVREGLRALLESEADFAIVGTVADGSAALEFATQLRPDVVIMDINMPGMDGFKATSMIKERDLPTKVIILSMFCEVDDIERAIQAGVDGFVAKQGASQELRSAVREVHRGNAYFSPPVLKLILDRHRFLMDQVPKELSLREKEVLGLVALSKTNRQIADQLGVSTKTVDKVRQHIMEKLDIHDAISLTRYAVEKGIIRS